jgi:hypothetical protein
VGHIHIDSNIVLITATRPVRQLQIGRRVSDRVMIIIDPAAAERNHSGCRFPDIKSVLAEGLAQPGAGALRIRGGAGEAYELLAPIYG